MGNVFGPVKYCRPKSLKGVIFTSIARLEDYETLLKFQDPASRNLAFNQFVRKCQRKVYWHVRKMVEDHHAANGCAPKP